MYKRLKSGEYQNMTPEQQAKHRRLLHNRWLRKPGNRARARAWNREYSHKYWEEKKDIPVLRTCKRCGKKVFLTGRKTICNKCKAIPSKTDLLELERRKRAELRFKKIDLIIKLYETTDLTQTQIADVVGTYQTTVSKTIRAYKAKRKKK